MSERLSSETIHATTVAKEGREVLLLGPSGSGKSDLALRLFDRGFCLISDDQTIVRREGKRLVASAPATIAGKFEVRGIGIVAVDPAPDCPVALAVEVTADVPRMPDHGRSRRILGIAVPLVAIDAAAASAAAKVELALKVLVAR
jgi:serine kinase of HPr protein (carbohydrate metabolism regulator)